MSRGLYALKNLLTAHRYAHPHQRVVVPLENLDPRAVAGWLHWKLSQHQLGSVRLGDIRSIKVLSDRRALILIGEAAAVDRLRELVEELDEDAGGAISLSCIPITTTQPQRLLCQPPRGRNIQLPDGAEIDPAAEISVERLCPVEPEYADEMVVVLNPYVSPEVVEQMVAAGVAEVGDQPRLIERKGLAGTVTFQCDHTMPSGKAGLRLAAQVGEQGLITVQVSIRCTGKELSDPLDEGRSATVQYVAYPGQTVAVGVVPASGCPGSMTVLLITADTVDTRARRQAENLARQIFQRLRQGR